MKIDKLKTLSLIGTFVAFIVTNYWSYTQGSENRTALLIETLSKYRSFYEEVNENYKIACDSDGRLQGLYLSQFNSMLPIIESEIEAPYDNPCPSPELSRPYNFAIHFCKGWDSWDDFLKDPEPTMTFNFPIGNLRYKINSEWKKAIIDWHGQMKDAMEKALGQCEESDDCTITITGEVKQ